MNRDDDQHLWDLLGRASRPKLSAFFSRNILRQVREEPELLGRTRRWLNWKILVPVGGVALALITAAAIFLRTPPPGSPVASSAEMPNRVGTSAKEAKMVAVAKAPQVAPREMNIDASVKEKEKVAAEKNDSPGEESGTVAAIDEQDYDTVANLDDLLVLYETSLWDENTSL